MIIVSSAYLMLVILMPFTWIPAMFSKASCISSSLDMLNRIGDIMHHCLTPSLILKLLDSSLLVLTIAVGFQYRYSSSMFFTSREHYPKN